jgi:hypothetical protein
MPAFFTKSTSIILMLALVVAVFAPVREARAAVAFGAIGSAATGTTSLSVAYPADIPRGSLIVLSVANKHPSNGPSTPTGWQLINNSQREGGIGSNAADSGSVFSTVFVRVADGSESGNVSVSIPSGDCAVGVISYYTKASNTVWDVVATRASDNTGGDTSWSMAMAAPGIVSGDMLITTAAVNTDDYSYSSQSVSATGATIGSHTERIEAATSNGNDCEVVVSTHAVTAGTSAADPVFTMTSSGSTANAPTGAAVLLRIREVATTTPQTTITSPVSVTGGISVFGALAKGAGTFVIDHPLDPKNKLLYHSFVESPEVKNIYDGIALLDAQGEATIALPAYFLALGRDYRHLATPVGEPMPNLYLKREVRKRFFGLLGQPVFTLAGGEPHGRVSWQVSAVRKDPFILANPIIPEVPKGPEEIVDVGEYVCVECYE